MIFLRLGKTIPNIEFQTKLIFSLKMDKFELYTLHSRKITSSVGIYNMVHVFPHVRSFTCWEPQFDIADLRYFTSLKNLTLLRIPFTGTRAKNCLRAYKSASPKLFRALISPYKFFFLCCLTCFDMAIASVPYQSTLND